MQLNQEAQEVSRLTYGANGDVLPVYQNQSAAISLPLGFTGLEGEHILCLGRFMFTHQPGGFPVIIGQYPDLTGVYHLSHNEIIVTTTRFGNEAGYIRYEGSDLQHRKLELPNRNRLCSITLSEGNVVAAYPHDHSIYAWGNWFKAAPQQGDVCLAAMNNRIAVACCDEISIHDAENFRELRRYRWGIEDELRDIKFSPDMLVMHVAYKNHILIFDLDE